jgi:hypothetical protein
VNGLLRLFLEQVDEKYASGMKAAVGVLARSQKPGRHEAKLKFSSARKVRTVHTDVYQAMAQAVEKALVWRLERTRFVATESPTDSAWFNAFMTGFKSRVGERRKQDAAISLLEEEWD